MTTVGTARPNDSWDQPSVNNASSRSKALLRPVPAQSVPDDWDDEEGDEEDDNQKIWEDANTRAPMPELVLTSSSTASTVAPPPITAFQTPMRILKRPSASHNDPSANASASPGASSHTLAEREARYQAARERIFGGDDGSGSNLSDTGGSGKSKLRGGGAAQAPASSPTQMGNVLRQPLGPEADSPKDGEVGKTPKGFKRRSTNGPQSRSQPGGTAVMG